MHSNAFNSKQSGVIDDPIQLILEDLALQLYKPKSNGASLMKGILRITPPVSDNEATSFVDYWLTRETQTPTFPQLWQFKKWLTELRKEDDTGCYFKICDGTGFIELYEHKKYPNNDFGDDYKFDKKCACIIGAESHKGLMTTYEYTPYQQVIIKSNGGNLKSFSPRVIRSPYNE
jgi:hypothetical protein